MNWQVAIISDKDLRVVLVAADCRTLKSLNKREKIIRIGERLYPGLPIVLIASDNSQPVFFGPQELVATLSQRNIYPIPWKRKSLPADLYH